MKKVGILSMQRIKNYGSFLQAYALKTMIEELGNKVEFVDYRVGEALIEDESSNSKLSKVTSILKGDAPLIQKIQYIIHKKNYDKKYLTKLNLTEEPNYTPELDVLVIGSDEVFNCIQKNKNVGYSLELFGKDNNAKKVMTYAASFGNTTTNKLKQYKKDKEIAGLLSKIDAISVRDNNSGNVVKDLTNKEVLFNLDPVLVFDYPNREGLIPEIETKEKYMIVYAYNNRIKKEESKWIKEYAKKNNLKVYAIGGAQSCADKFIDCSPFEVLAYFKNAECIITDTFHGSIFSIIMQKPFVTLVRKSVGNEYGNEEKLTDLLERLNLKERITYNIEQIDQIIKLKIDYKNVNKILGEQRNNTIKYLQEQLLDSSYTSINKKNECCGCGACMNICPKNAITMVENELGFKYPKIDESKCIKCNLCKKVCNYIKEKDKNIDSIKTYATVIKDVQKLKKSASGGAFFALAQNIIKQGGVVYGAASSFEKKLVSLILE